MTGLLVPLLLHMLTVEIQSWSIRSKSYAGTCALTLTEVTIFKWRKQITNKGH